MTTAMTTTPGSTDTSPGDGGTTDGTDGTDTTDTTDSSTSAAEGSSSGTMATTTTATTGDTDGCGEPAAGAWVDCANGEDCGSPNAACVEVAQGEAATCVFTPNGGAGCVDTCDCPAAPDSGDAVVACGDVEGNGGPDACYLDCSDGTTCPDGQSCYADLVCAWPTASTGGAYEACNPPDFPCEDGSICLIDGIPATIGACIQTNCLSVDMCPDGPPGTTVECADVAEFIPGLECHLVCSVDADCPAGATCYLESLCVYPAPS